MITRPARTCLGCRAIRNKKELLRVVRTPSGEVRPDPDGKMDGRGAYICRRYACLARVMKTGAMQRALKCRIPEEVWESLRRETADDG